MEARGEKRWLVMFDNGEQKECGSSGLKVEIDPRYNYTLANMVQIETQRGIEDATREEAKVPEEQEAAEGLELQEQQVTEQIPDEIPEQLANQLPEEISEEGAQQLRETMNGLRQQLNGEQPDNLVNQMNADSPSQNTRSSGRAPIRDPENDWLNNMQMSDDDSNGDDDDDVPDEEGNDLNRGVETTVEEDIVEGLGEDAGFDVVEEVHFDEHQLRRNEAMEKREN
jgi:hypothetical protein